MEALSRYRGEINDIIRKHEIEENRIYNEDEMNLNSFKKLFVKTDEYITKILLKLDSIQSNGDEVIRFNRKRLINWCNDYLDYNDKYKHGIIMEYDTDYSSSGECSE